MIIWLAVCPLPSSFVDLMHPFTSLLPYAESVQLCYSAVMIVAGVIRTPLGLSRSLKTQPKL